MVVGVDDVLFFIGLGIFIMIAGAAGAHHKETKSQRRGLYDAYGNQTGWQGTDD